jgi:carbamoyl-phosphate synthase large subunit
MYVSVEALAAGTSAVVLVGVLIWRLTARRQPVKMLRRALVDPDAGTRRAAITIAAERGLRPYVDLLVERARAEPDSSVRRELAEAVARNQWEPTDRRGLLELRLWAQTQLAATGGQAETGAPSVPVASAINDSPSSGILHDHGGTGNGQVSTAAVGGNPAAVIQSKPRGTAVLARAAGKSQPPAPVKVMVTGAGGPAGVAVLRALQQAGHGVVAVDADSLAAGLRIAPQGAIVPRGDDPTFGRVVCQIAGATEANVLMSTVAEELPALAEMSAELKEAGLRTWLPDPRAVHTCLDKWEFVKFASEKGIPVPATALGSAEGVPGAWVVKPRFGRGSRGVHFVDRHSDLAWHLQQVGDPIVQTRLQGREFTVDALVDRKGRLAGAVPRWRLAVTGGISVKGRTFEDADLVQAVGDLLSRLRLHGPSNVQGVMAVDGSPTFIEVNPRFSGGLPLSLAAGADLVGEYLRAILGQPIRPERLRARAGVTMIRHFEELFE